MKENELQLAPGKTQALVITHKRKWEGLRFNLDNVNILSKRRIKYLVLFFDTKGKFRENLQYVTGKAIHKTGREEGAN